MLYMKYIIDTTDLDFNAVQCQIKDCYAYSDIIPIKNKKCTFIFHYSPETELIFHNETGAAYRIKIHVTQYTHKLHLNLEPNGYKYVI